MRIFHCDTCGHVLFFENSECVSCGSRLAYVPESSDLVSLEPAADPAAAPPATFTRNGVAYKLCGNYNTHHVCNWALLAADPQTLCRSCRLTRIIPELSQSEALPRWYKLEIAKRRLLFTLFTLGLPVAAEEEKPGPSLSFEFKATPADGSAPPVMTGHADGVITIDVAESDDAEREGRRHGLHEPYRTLLGHMRHESGHFYWDLLIKDSPAIESFRALFGDERADYAAALAQHYQNGAPADWVTRSVSAYASAHPWEDWAETWAHYLHMVDTLETAAQNGLMLKPTRADEPTLSRVPRSVATGGVPFDRVIESWFPLTYVLNNLNRGLGLADGYPFVLSPGAVEKLRFVHESIALAAKSHGDAVATVNGGKLV